MDFGAFGAVQENFEKVLHYSTPFGHAWTFVVVIFRLLPAIFLGDGMYGDEYDQFECLGAQPGCAQICFSQFSPMQPPRMWCLQILLSSLPPVVFHFFASRQQIKYEKMKEEMTNLEKELRESEAQAENNSMMSNHDRSMASQAYDLKYRKYQHYNNAVKAYKFKQVPNYDPEEGDAKTKRVLWSPKIRMGYIVHLVIKLIFEMIFFYAVYWYQCRQTNLTGLSEIWYSPEYYQCRIGDPNYYPERSALLSKYNINPCSQDKEVICWVVRAQEKELYMYYNIFMQILCIAIICADIAFVTTKSAKKARRNHKVKQREKLRLIHESRASQMNSRMAMSRVHSRTNTPDHHLEVA